MPQPDDPAQPLAEHTLQRLHHLQELVAETSAELRQLERLVSKALLRSDTHGRT